MNYAIISFRDSLELKAWKVKKFLYDNRFMIAVALTLFMTALMIHPSFAETNDIFQVGQKVSTNIFDKVKNLYMHGVAYALAIICLLLLAFSHDDKKKQVYLTWLKVIIGVYFAMWLLPVILQTFTTIFQGSGVEENTSIN